MHRTTVIYLLKLLASTPQRALAAKKRFRAIMALGDFASIMKVVYVQMLLLVLHCTPLSCFGTVSMMLYEARHF
jgi:hypothetical protein